MITNLFILNMNQGLFSSAYSDLESLQNGINDGMFRFREKKPFFSSPFTKPLLVSNQISEARDIYAFERNFLSWMKITLYLTIAGGAVMTDLRFVDHSKPHEKALRMLGNGVPKTTAEQISELDFIVYGKTVQEHLATYPLGAVFYALAFLAIMGAFYTYITTINAYCKEQIEVNNTLPSTIIIGLIAAVILGTNIYVLLEL